MKIRLSLLVLFVLFISCAKKEHSKYSFKEIKSSHSGIDFNNIIIEDDTLRIVGGAMVGLVMLTLTVVIPIAMATSD